MALQTKVHPTTHGRILAAHNFYSRQTLFKELFILTDSEEIILGTFRMNLVDAVNRPELKISIGFMQRSDRVLGFLFII